MIKHIIIYINSNSLEIVQSSSSKSQNNFVILLQFLNIFVMLQYFKKYVKKDYYNNIPVPKFRTNFTNCILQNFKRRNYKQTDQDDWDIYWSEKDNIAEIYQTKRLLPNQKVNHFRNYFQICRKDLLIRNLKKHKKALQRDGKPEESAQYNFFPMTYILPSQYVIFVDQFKKAQQQNDRNVWIMKPISRSQGKGIFLFNKLSAVSNWENHSAENYIVQKYIADPLLIGGKKFDMRIYVLVTSFSPLTIYLYRSGFARFTHYRYEEGKINQAQIHLTNVAIQKNTDNYDEHLGGKWMLAKMKSYLISKYGLEKINLCFSKIQETIIKTLEAVQKVMVTDKNHSFELYGFDILLDSQFQPWLLQINGSPSMTANTPTDMELKLGVLDDTLSVIDMQKLLSDKQQQIGGFDLIYKVHPIKLPSPNINSNFLGTYNNRLQNLKKIAKANALRLNQQYDQKKQLENRKAPMTSNSNMNKRVHINNNNNKINNNNIGNSLNSNINKKAIGKKEFIIKSKVRKQGQNEMY